MPLYNLPPPPSNIVYFNNQNDKEEKISASNNLGESVSRAFGYKILFDDFLDIENTDDDDDDE